MRGEWTPLRGLQGVPCLLWETGFYGSMKVKDTLRDVAEATAQVRGCGIVREWGGWEMGSD